MNEKLDLTQLREVAEKATPGNWMWVNDREDEHIRAGKFPYNHVTYTADVEDVNALHIATFDPTTVLALLDRIKYLKGQAHRNYQDWQTAYARAEAAEAAVQRVRDMHSKRVAVYMNGIEEHYCAHDDSSWPCDTIRALDGGEQG